MRWVGSVPLWAIVFQDELGTRVREQEFWERLSEQLGHDYARFWANQTVLDELGGRTVLEGLAAGIPVKQIWRAVWAVLELPDVYR